jgi:hypothetical protein
VVIARTSLLLLLVAGCSDSSADDDIRAHVTFAIKQEGKVATDAAEYLQRYGRRAIPTIEAAMHTATPEGKKNLILALRKIGDVEAVPLLRHVALFDPSRDVQREAEWTLKSWAAGAAGEPRTEKARAALRAIDEQRGSEEAG